MYRMHVSSSYSAFPFSAQHSMYSSALLIAGCWSKIIVIFQPVGLKSYNIMKCIKKKGEMADRRHAKSNVERSE